MDTHSKKDDLEPGELPLPGMKVCQILSGSSRVCSEAQ